MDIYQTVEQENKYHCPLTGIEIFKCPVIGCIWYSQQAPHYCFYRERITPEEFAKYKGIPIHRVEKLVKRSVSLIKQVIILYRFLEYIIENKKDKIVPERLVKRLDDTLTKFPYTYREGSLYWNRQRLMAALDSKIYQEFAESNKIRFKHRYIVPFSYWEEL